MNKNRGSKTPPVENSNVFICCNQQFSEQDMMLHLKTVHKIRGKLKAHRQMNFHLDSEDHFISTYEWTIGKLKFHQSVRCKRDPEDMMYWK